MGADVKARLILDSSGFTQGLDKAKASLNRFSTGQLGAIKGKLAAAFTVGAITNFASHVIDVGSRLNDLSIQTGISAEELQKLSFVATQNGSSMEGVVSAFRKLSVSMKDGLDSSGETRKAFEEVGVSLDDLKKLSAQEVFLKLADAVKNSKDQTATQASIIKLLGRSASDLIPTLSIGSDEIRRFGDEAQRAGAIMDNETVKAMDDLGDSLDLLKAKSTSAFAPFLANVAKGAVFVADLTRLQQNLTASVLTMNKQFALESLKEFSDPKKQPEVKKVQSVIDRDANQAQSEKDRVKREQEAREKRLATLIEAITKTQRDMLLETLDLENRILFVQQEIQDERSKEIDDAEQKLESQKKILDLQREELGIQKELEDKNIKTTDAFGKNIAENIEFNEKIAEIKSGKGISVSGIISDSLARIGGFVGGANDNQSRLLEKTSLIADQLKEANKTLEKINAGRGFGEEIPDATAQ